MKSYRVDQVRKMYRKGWSFRIEGEAYRFAFPGKIIELHGGCLVWRKFLCLNS